MRIDRVKRRNTAGKWHTTRQHEQKSRIQVDTLDWIGQCSCHAWPSRDPRSKCHAWCTWENTILCIPCIRGGRLKISGPNNTTAAHAFVKATLRLGLRAPFVARNKKNLSYTHNKLLINLVRLVITGKSQAEASDSDSEVNTSRPRSEIFL